jgi:hypothetical protein
MAATRTSHGVCRLIDDRGIDGDSISRGVGGLVDNRVDGMKRGMPKKDMCAITHLSGLVYSSWDVEIVINTYHEYPAFIACWRISGAMSPSELFADSWCQKINDISCFLRTLL